MSLGQSAHRQRYLIAYLLEKLEDGYEFDPNEYPLHVTIVPSFILDSIDAKTIKAIQDICANTKTISLTALDDAYFGPNKDIAVSPFATSEPLLFLHTQLSEALKRHGAEFEEEQYMFDAYRAHASVQKSARLRQGDEVTIDSITIIDKFPGSNPDKRRVLERLTLRGI